ncbi:MAG TPA: DUF1552 domain-containing protein [Terriglobia bacterium]|nr:DUF1552 domain-containing protein [Terriglobia bacterium]
MFISKRHLPRRTFLKGAGVTLALPLLDAMVPAATALAQTAATPPPRFVGIFFPHGLAYSYWEMTEGPIDKMSYIMEPLTPVKDRTLVLGGLWSQSAEPPEGTTGSDHWVAAAFMTGIKPRKTTGADATVGSATIDQQIAQRIGKDSLLPSLQLAVEDPNSSSSNCGEGYSCSYTNSISWVEVETPAEETVLRTKPLPMELDPQVVFERLFGSGATPEDRAKRRKLSQSILDSVRSELGSIKKELGAADRRVVDDYATEIHEIERRIQLAASASSTIPLSDEPNGIPEDFDTHIKLHFDLTTLAFKADITRVATLLGARDLTGVAYPLPRNEWFPEGGRTGSFHGLSHHQEIAKNLADYAKLNRYHVSTLSHFAQRLQATPDGDGTLLDHSLILYGSNMGNSNQHMHYDVGHTLVGGANGKLKGGRFLTYPMKTVTTGNLLLSILHMFGIDREKQGDSNGPLAKL